MPTATGDSAGEKGAGQGSASTTAQNMSNEPLLPSLFRVLFPGTHTLLKAAGKTKNCIRKLNIISTEGYYITVVPNVGYIPHRGAI